MGIVDEDVARVRDQTDLAALVGEYTAVKRVGRRFMALCPFHQEKTPSFSINPELNLYKCFGCDKGGDPITFLREIEHIDFVDAVERLAQRANIQLRYDDRSASRDRSRRARLVEAVAAAVDFYHRALLEAPEGGTARKYLRGRGFDGDAARRFVLGWAPDDWDALSRHLQRAKFSRDDLTETGLAFVNRVNKLQDQFRARLMFPIYDAKGEPVGFGGRTLGADGPKYKNSPETPIYQKSRLLYGLNWARTEIVARNEAIICEGYTDVMAYALAGCPNAVATCGTALADEHAKMLKNLARRVVLAYDADSAGQGAAERWYRWEQELDLEVRVAALPPGNDPGDLWRDDRERLPASVERAEPFLQFRVDRELAGADLSTIEGRARAAEAAAAMVAQHPSELVRDQYALQLAERLDLTIDGVRGQIARAHAGGGRRPYAGAARHAGSRAEPEGAPPARRGAATGAERRELDVLLWAIHEPELVNGWLDAELFVDPTTREMYQLLIDHSDLHDAIDAADGEARRLLERLAVEEPDEGDEPETLRARLVVNTVEPVAKRMLVRLLREDDQRATTVKATLDVLAHSREVGDWPRAQAAAEQLVGWIVHEARPAPEHSSSEWVENRVEQQA
jgi:DNA primase